MGLVLANGLLSHTTINLTLLEAVCLISAVNKAFLILLWSLGKVLSVQNPECHPDLIIHLRDGTRLPVSFTTIIIEVLSCKHYLRMCPVLTFQSCACDNTESFTFVRLF